MLGQDPLYKLGEEIFYNTLLQARTPLLGKAFLTLSIDSRAQKVIVAAINPR